ncbi:MAG TPA: xanthine dehydrogenase family protein molybdopterin-binding subunit [Ktedonobacterales bacterium]|nr:xanthine dehydrogenase family protein molybdopterin-binding subunit [Ktedonobacterales bacterium]
MTQSTDQHDGAERKWVGKSIRRVEDPRFLTGRGHYVDDISLPGMLHAATLRSPYAHARITRINVEAARQLPGVVAVVTGAEAAELCNPMPDFGPAPDKHVWRCLAYEKVRYVGESVVAVVAESRYIAEDARDLIEVEYEPLAPVVDPEAALEPGAALVHDALGSNLAYERTFKFGEVDRDFAEAEVVVRDRLRWHRSSGQPLETVGAVADFDIGSGKLTIYCNSLTFTHFLFMVANTLNVPSNKLDMIPINAGGSFGSKFWAVKVPVVAGMLAKLVGRPVKLIEDRLDNISNSDHHGSDRIYEAEMAAMRDGTLRSLRLKVIDDYGAYIQFGTGTHGNSLAQLTGPYRIKSAQYQLQAALTNKNQQGAYRGFGSEVTNWMVERMVDLVARQLQMDPVAIRRMNFIQPDQFPYFIPTGNMYDSGNYEAVLNKAVEMLDYDAWRKEQERLRQQGRYVGIGVISAQERSVFSATEFWFWFDEPAAKVTSSPESVRLNVDATGSVTATLYSQAFWGQAAETMVAQLVAEEFDVDPYSVAVVYAGSNNGLPATGPGGSRFTVMVAGAVRGAAERIKDKAFKVAEHLLEANVADLEWHDGAVRVKGNPSRSKSLAEIALWTHLFKHSLPDEIESGLEANKVYDHPYTTMPNADRTNLGVFYPFVGHACHLPVIEVDIETGHISFLKYVAVHDAGTVVNPRSLAGQVVGGTAQGIGTALYEQFVYGPDGQLLTGSYMDYLIPTSMEVPELEIGHVETPSPFTVHGIKGGGEGGRMMTPAALSAAIDDALSPFGVRCNELPATPDRIVQWIEAARDKQTSTG